MLAIALLCSRIHPTIHTKALEPGDAIVYTCYPVDDEKKVDDKVKGTERVRGIRSTVERYG